MAIWKHSSCLSRVPRRHHLPSPLPLFWSCSHLLRLSKNTLDYIQMLMQLYFTHLCWLPFDSNLMTILWRNLEVANHFTDVFYEYMRLVEMAFIHILKFVVQVLELWLIKYGSFCARKRRKATTWLQEEEYSVLVMELHWISLCGKRLCRFKVSTNQRSQQRGFAMRFCSEWTANKRLFVPQPTQQIALQNVVSCKKKALKLYILVTSSKFQNSL